MKSKPKVLCFQPYNQTVVYIESIFEKFAEIGCQTYLLTFAEQGDTHKNMKRFGCSVYSLEHTSRMPLWYQVKRVWQLVNFCNKHDIDVVYSHYQEANLIAVLAQFFTKAKFIITRHHSDCGYLDHNQKEIIADKIINHLAKIQIAPSFKVYHQMVNVEGCKPDRIKRIDYGYNFERFPAVNKERVVLIRNQAKSDMTLVMAARFIPEKRHQLLFDVIKSLVEEGHDIKAFVPGRGPKETSMKQYVTQLQLEDNIIFPGFQRDIQNYYAAADLIVHLSVSEASNSAIKEAALQNKTAIVCEGVGDFSDYIIHEQNGFLINIDQSFEELRLLLKNLYANRQHLTRLGQELRATVLEKFDIDHIFSAYIELQETLSDRKVNKLSS